MSKIKYSTAAKDGRFLSTHVAGYKQVIDHGKTAEDTKGVYIVDTGNNGNLFQGNYFDLNPLSLSGKLLPMIQGKDIQTVANKTLVIKNSSKKPAPRLDRADSLIKHS